MMSEENIFLSDKTIVLENILKEISGFKKFQIINYTLIFLTIFLTTFNSLSYIFTASDLNYRCEISFCDKNTSSYNPDWLPNAVPFQNGIPSQCERYAFAKQANDIDNGLCSVESFDNSSLVQCDTFIYETEEKTILNEWNLTCSQNRWKLTMVGTVNIMGSFVGLPLLGYFGDRFGRKAVISYGMLCSAVIGFVRSMSGNYIMFLFFEFLDPLVSAGVYGTAFVLGLELVRPEVRFLGGSIISAAFAFGQAFLGYIAMLVQNWRLLIRICYTPYFLYVFYLCAVPESIIWLHSKKRFADVSKAIKTVAAINKIKLSDKAVAALADYKNSPVELGVYSTVSIEKRNSNPSKNESLLLQVLKSRTLITRLVISAILWTTNTFVYYGISLNSVSLGGNKYTNFMLVSLVEIPGYIACYIFGDIIGRRYSLCGSLLFSGFACLLTPFVDHIYWTKLVLSLVGKFAITASFAVLYIYTAEIFPTYIRNSMVGISSTFGRFGHILAPQIPLVASIMASLPMILFGVTAIIAGLLGLTLPETLNKKLPDTVDEASKMDKKIGRRVKY